MNRGPEAPAGTQTDDLPGGEAAAEVREPNGATSATGASSATNGATNEAPAGAPNGHGATGPGRVGAAALGPEVLDDDRGIRRLVFNLAWPVIVENLLQTAVGVVDLLMVSRLGAAAIAGVGVSVQVLFVIFAGISAIATGTTVLVARFSGAGQQRDAARVLKQSILLGIFLGLFLAVIGIPASKPVVRLLGAEPDVVELGGGYLEVVFATSVALTLSFILGAALRGAGDSRTPMLAALGTNAVNVVVAYVLIFGVGGFPELGVIGSAWGAAAGRAFGALVLLAVCFKGSRMAAARLPRLSGSDGWLPDIPLMQRLMRIGVPSMGEQLSRSLGMLLFSWIVIHLGTTVFAAQRITFNIISLSFLPGFGFSMAATALTGQALGAGRPDRARRVTWFATRSAMLWMGLMGAFFLLTAPLLMRLFTDDPEIIASGSPALRVLGFGQIQMALGLVLAGGLRGAGDTRFPMLVVTVGMWLVRIPVALLAVHVLHWGLPGAYLAFVVGSTLESLAMWLRYRTGRWQHLKV